MKRLVFSILILGFSFVGYAHAQTTSLTYYPRFDYAKLNAYADSTKLILHDTTFVATTTPGGTAYKVIVGSLNDPAVCWDLQQFRKLEKNTSWYAPSGPFPTEFAITITNGQDSVIVWDRLKANQWMIFAAGATNLIEDATPTLTDIKFLDGILYVSGSGGADITRIDFVSDKAHQWSTGGISNYNSTLSNRNGSSGWIILNTSPAIVNNTVNAVSVIRDPDGGIDEFGRPKHAWKVQTAGGESSYIPSRDAIYDSNITGSWLWGDFLGSGYGFSLNSDATRDNLQWKYTYQTIAADAYTFDEVWANNGSGSEAIPWDNATIFSQNVAVPNASVVGNVSPLVIFGSDSGLVVSHAKRNDNTNGLTFVIDSRALWGPWSATADSLGWPFERAADTLNVWGKRLTRAGTGAGVTYGAGVIGQAATLDGSVNGYFTRQNDQSFRLGTANFAILQWFKLAATASETVIWELQGTSHSSGLYLAVTTSNYSYNVSGASGGTTISTTITPDDDKWHFSVAQRSGANIVLYLDGEQVGSVSDGAGAMTVDTLFVGAKDGGLSRLTGSIDQWQKIPRALSASEIRWLYQQGLRGIQSSVDPNDALHANDVDYVSVDPNGRWIVVGNQDSVTIFDEFFIPKYRYASPNGVMNSVALWTDAGADSLSYALGTSTRLRLTQTDVRIAEMTGQQSPGQGAHDPVWRLPFYAVAPEDSGTVTQGAWTITGADSSGKFKYADTSPGNLRVGLNAEVRGSLRYGSASAVGADIAEMFAVAGSNYRIVIRPIASNTKELFAPALIRASTITIYDNDSTRTYPFEIHKSTQTERARLFLDVSVKGRNGLATSSVIYANGVETGDTLRYRVDSLTVVAVRVNVVLGDTVGLSAPVPKETEFWILPPNLLVKYTGSQIQAGDVVQMGPGKTMRLSQGVGKRGWVVSSGPATLLNADMEGVPVALMGTVPCVVAFDGVRGAVTVGDPLTAGANGMAVKALAGEPILGWAQEAVTSGTRKIGVLVE